MTEQPALIVGRYLLNRRIARGGMATIHIARLLGDVGFSRVVAAKRMHPELAEDQEFVTMFLDEARIASRVSHRNVVNVLDVVTLGDEVMLVQEYVHGAPLGVLLRSAYDSKSHVPIPVAAAIACQVLAGLHAAHETLDERGTPLEIVHRDVSPQNIIIAADGSARLLDFGIAKAALSAHVTRKGTFKGKLGYSSPEQIRGDARRQSDVYSLGVVLWELIVGDRIHASAQSDAQLIAEILSGRTKSVTDALASERAYIGAYRWSQLEAIEPVIRKALDVKVRRRWQTAADMEEAIAAVVPLASPSDVAAWLRAVGKSFLDERDKVLAEEEASWRRNAPALLAHRPSSNENSAPPPPPTIPVDATPAPTLTAAWRPRIPTTILATLVVTLVALVALLMRDLDGTTVSAPQATPEPAPEPIVPTEQLPVATTVASPPVLGPPPVEPEPTLRVTKPTPRRAVRPTRVAPAVRTVAPPRPADTLDCSTPFYFEGRKKVFKPGCL